MTEKLYWQDPYRREFEGTVVSARAIPGHTEVVLDRTVFYPASGGQPADTGMLGSSRVADVVDRDGEIVHVLDGSVSEGAKVNGAIDWSRRFDLMQQHTGQHILSQAFIARNAGETLSVHIGSENSTLELSREDLSDETLESVESLANTIIEECRPVKCYFVRPDEASNLDLRKPAGALEQVRIVEVDRFDLSPCGGTHVANSGELGIIKITGRDRVRQHLKVDFLVGRRALADYSFKNSIVAGLAREFTVNASDLPGAVKRLQDEVKSARKTLKEKTEELALIESRRLSELAGRHGNLRFLKHFASGKGRDDVISLSKSLARFADLVSLVGFDGEKKEIFLTAPPELDEILKRVVEPRLREIGGKGGGKRGNFQGFVPDSVNLPEFLDMLESGIIGAIL